MNIVAEVESSKNYRPVRQVYVDLPTRKVVPDVDLPMAGCAPWPDVFLALEPVPGVAEGVVGPLQILSFNLKCLVETTIRTPQHLVAPMGADHSAEKFNGMHKAIVSESDFAKVNAIMGESAKNPRASSPAESPLTLPGITKCGQCEGL